MDLVLCHTTADFDTLGAAVGLTRLYPSARIVLAGGCHPTVQNFLALHRDEYPLLERRAVNIHSVQKIAVVDTQSLDRLGAIATWITAVAAQQGEIVVYDHHLQADRTIAATEIHIDAVGAATTLVTEQLQAQSVQLTPAEATVMALGIHVDTGSLTFASATARDAAALAWLMAAGASQTAIAAFVDPSLSESLQTVLETAIAQFQRESFAGHTLGWVGLEAAAYIPGLSGLTERLMSLMDVDSLVLASWYVVKATQKLVLIGRARGKVAAQGDRPGIDFNQLFAPLGGGGHATAASVTMTTNEPETQLQSVLAALRQQIPPAPVAGDLMSSPVRTIRPHTLITEAQRILLRYGHSGLSVVNDAGQLVGIISRRDIDLALHHGFGHAPVKGYMSTQVQIITPTTTLPAIEALMVTYDIGRLPVIDDDHLVGIVTRTDVLRQLHQAQDDGEEDAVGLAVPIVRSPSAQHLQTQLQQRLTPDLWVMLMDMAAVAAANRWQLYLIGGAVRDLFLTPTTEPLQLQDIDLVVDSAYQTLEMGAGVVLAQAVQAKHPEAELQVYGRFQTAALVWHDGFTSDGTPLMIDIATARTEFYPYPAANPEVEASSIRQDLYRRDFTINALAIALTPPHPGQLLDFFGGLIDLQRHHIRVLHANSFIEDPTRIYRAVRFAVRLGFRLEPQTEGFIRHALESGVYKRLQQEIAKLPALQTRLRAELKYILEAHYWEAALALLDHLGALICLHPDLCLSDRLWQQMRRLSRWLQRVDQLANLTPWQMRLELLITAVPAVARQTVTENLQLPQSSITRLASLATVEATLLSTLPQCNRPSRCVRHLRQYDTETLLLLSVRHPHAIGDRIWRYLMVWAAVKAPLNGNDLRQLGYRPGPEYRTMLEALLAATLDGTLKSRAEAEAFIVSQYPLPPSL